MKPLWRDSPDFAMLGLGAMLLGSGVYCATHSVDFPVYHRAAAQIARGDYEIYPAAVYGAGVVPTHGFRYAPAIAFLFVPFGLLPLGAATFLFFTLKVGAVVYVGSVVARYAGYSTPTRTLMLASLLLAAGYVVEEFRYGNFHFFCIALMVFAFDSAGRDRHGLAALVRGPQTGDAVSGLQPAFFRRAGHAGRARPRRHANEVD